MTIEDKDFACNEIIKSIMRANGSDIELFEYGGVRTPQEQSLLDAGADPLEIPTIMGEDAIDRSRVAPLDCIEVFLDPNYGEYWQYVSMGFSNLYSEGLDDDGADYFCKFELTLRLKAFSEESPPLWPLQLMQNIAHYIFSTGNRFNQYEHFHLNGPIVRLPGVTNEVIVFNIDPELGVLDTDAGEVTMLQMVGITLDEYAQMKKWRVDKFLGLLESKNLLNILDPYRKSILEDLKCKQIVSDGIKKDGSSYGTEFTDELTVKKSNNIFSVTVSVLSIPSILDALQTRLSFARDFKLIGPEEVLKFSTAKTSRIYIENKESDDEINCLTVELCPKAIEELAFHLKPERGTYKLASVPNFAIVVTPAEIINRKGQVVKTIG
jgi:hypothetical protein